MATMGKNLQGSNAGLQRKGSTAVAGLSKKLQGFDGASRRGNPAVAALSKKLQGFDGASRRGRSMVPATGEMS